MILIKINNHFWAPFLFGPWTATRAAYACVQPCFCSMSKATLAHARTQALGKAVSKSRGCPTALAMVGERYRKVTKGETPPPKPESISRAGDTRERREVVPGDSWQAVPLPGSARVPKRHLRATSNQRMLAPRAEKATTSTTWQPAQRQAPGPFK